MSDIPTLEAHCGSWILTRRATGEVIGEFYDSRSFARFDPQKVLIETAVQYLSRINREIAEQEDPERFDLCN